MEEKNFVAYEYKTRTVKAEDQPRLADMYEAFGWEITSASPAVGGGVALSLKRDRKIVHKQELNKTERQAENVFETLASLRRSETLGASVFAYIFGLIGALMLGGGMSLIMTIQNSVPALAGGIVLGVVGLALCGINYMIYKKLALKKTEKVQPAIDENEEKLANLLEKGNELLAAGII